MYSSLTLMRQGIILKISVLKRVHGIVVWGWIYLVYGIFLKRQRQHSREFWVLCEVVPFFPWFNLSTTLVNSRLVSLWGSWKYS